MKQELTVEELRKIREMMKLEGITIMYEMTSTGNTLIYKEAN